MAPEHGKLAPAAPPELAALIDRARLEWLAAQNEFNSVTEPDLVDHAIYAMHAAERRYVYLLRLAARLRQQAPEALTDTPARRPASLPAGSG